MIEVKSVFNYDNSRNHFQVIIPENIVNEIESLKAFFGLSDVSKNVVYDMPCLINMFIKIYLSEETGIESTFHYASEEIREGYCGDSWADLVDTVGEEFEDEDDEIYDLRDNFFDLEPLAISFMKGDLFVYEPSKDMPYPLSGPFVIVDNKTLDLMNKETLQFIH